MKKNDLYIEILSFGRANLGVPVKFGDLKDHLDKKGYDFDEFAVANLFCGLFVDKGSPNGNIHGKPRENGEFFLEHEGYFHLLEHEELVSARKSSLQATVFACVAIVISIISALSSIYYSNMQLNTPTSLASSQLKKLSNENLERKVDHLISDINAGAESIIGIRTDIESIKAHSKSIKSQAMPAGTPQSGAPY